MRFTDIDINFDIRYEGHQNCPKILSMNILRVFSDNHLWCQNWRQYLWTSLCQFNSFVNLLHSLHVWLSDIWHLFDNLTSFWQFDIFLTFWHITLTISAHHCLGVKLGLRGTHVCPIPLYPSPMWPICPVPHTPVPYCPICPYPFTPYPLYPITPCGPHSLYPLPMCLVPHTPVPYCPCDPLPMWPIPPVPPLPIGSIPLYPIAHVAHTPCTPYALCPYCPCVLYPLYPMQPIAHTPCTPYPLCPIAHNGVQGVWGTGV